MAGFRLRIDVEGERPIVEGLNGVRRRLEDHEEAYEKVARLLEKEHGKAFRRFRMYDDPKTGRRRRRYRRTGATMTSLTGSGPMALREIGAQRLDFGTRVLHARYLTMAPRDPELGQVDKPNGKGRSAVVVFPERVQRAAVKQLADFVTEPGRKL